MSPFLSQIKTDVRPVCFTETPDGFCLGYSFAEPSIYQAELDTVFQNSEPEIESFYSEFDQKNALSDSIRFDEETPISWQSYLQIEAILDEFLCKDTLSPGRCLIAGHGWLGMLKQLLQTAVRDGNQNPDEVITFYIERTRSESFGRAWSLVDKEVGNPTIKRQALGSALAYRERLNENDSAFMSSLRMTLINLKHWAQWGNVTFIALRRRVCYCDFEPDPSTMETPEAQKILRRWLRHALFRKDLVRHSSLLRGFGLLVLMHGLVEWHIAALPEEERTDDPVAAMQRAIGAVDDTFATDPRFAELYLYHASMVHTLDFMFAKPAFPHSIIRT